MKDLGGFRTKKQSEIELAVTNGLGFKDSPKNYSIKLEGEVILLHLRAHLGAMQANVSLNSRDTKKYAEAINYFGDLCRISQAGYQENFNLNNSKGIDNALKFYRKGLVKMFNTQIGAVA